ncbi:pilus assembly protein [Pseudomonas sp. PA1(2017)]|uniref:Flp family type IVb pilin n=1 Tax=Pseudomonas sp. PA1(2017) TaxID=1932113 RepID=UPI000967CEC4|nr:Flp family type IVb pilin [Pseudomonas sp. PA1(2017)]OLU21070.1 pilus assembly protein [Pseudomonas sp. PA1(2017)]
MFTLIILREKIRQFFASEEGASAIEYSIIAALIAVVIVGAVTDVGEQVNGVFEQIRDALTPAANP